MGPNGSAIGEGIHAGQAVVDMHSAGKPPPDCQLLSWRGFSESLQGAQKLAVEVEPVAYLGCNRGTFLIGSQLFSLLLDT